MIMEIELGGGMSRRWALTWSFGLRDGKELGGERYEKFLENGDNSWTSPAGKWARAISIGQLMALITKGLTE